MPLAQRGEVALDPTTAAVVQHFDHARLSRSETRGEFAALAVVCLVERQARR
jgi:hypothetical protein